MDIGNDGNSQFLSSSIVKFSIKIHCVCVVINSANAREALANHEECIPGDIYNTTLHSKGGTVAYVPFTRCYQVLNITCDDIIESY